MAHLDRAPNLGNQERTAVYRNVTDSQCLYTAQCKRRMCKGEKRRGGVRKKKKSYFWRISPSQPRSLLSVLPV